MMDRVEIAVWIIWCVWVYSVAGALTVTMYKPPLVWNPHLGEFVVARDFEHNTAASNVFMHPSIGPIGQGGFREPFYQLPQFKYYPYSPYHFDRLPTGAHMGEEELLRNNDYESEPEEVTKLTQHPVENLQDYNKYESEFSSSEIGPSFQPERILQSWSKNVLSTNMKVLDKKPTRKYLPPFINDSTSADKRAKRSILLDRFEKLDNSAIAVPLTDDLTNPSRRMIVRRTLLPGGESVHVLENEDDNTKVTEQTPKTNTIKSRTIGKSRIILSKNNNYVKGTEEACKVNSNINSKFGTSEHGKLPNPRAYPQMKYQFASKIGNTRVLESARPVVNSFHNDIENLPENLPATSETSTQNRHEFYKKNFFKMVQTAHAMYPNKYNKRAKNTCKEIVGVTETFPRKNNNILKNKEFKLEESINDIELKEMDPNEKYSEYNMVPKERAKNIPNNSNDIKLSYMDPGVKDSEYNRVPKENDKETRSNVNEIDHSTTLASDSTSTTALTTTPARPVFVSASLPSLNSYRYNTFQPPPVMSSYAPSSPVGRYPVGYPSYDHKPIAGSTGFTSNIARWILQSIPLPIIP